MRGGEVASDWREACGLQPAARRPLAIHKIRKPDIALRSCVPSEMILMDLHTLGRIAKARWRTQGGELMEQN